MTIEERKENLQKMPTLRSIQSEQTSEPVRRNTDELIEEEKPQAEEESSRGLTFEAPKEDNPMGIEQEEPAKEPEGARPEEHNTNTTTIRDIIAQLEQKASAQAQYHGEHQGGEDPKSSDDFEPSPGKKLKTQDSEQGEKKEEGKGEATGEEFISMGDDPNNANSNISRYFD
jgi:hypothetical protein